MDTLQAITPRQVIEHVQELATADYGPIGIVNFEFIPLANGPGVKANWDLAFRVAPADTDTLNYSRIQTIQRAIAEAQAAFPRVRWP
ncbi:hypothetical protein [Pleomorphomonas sp. PLEO]|uniref:hypothetical protein n=1 Tax=Pleomorphomonas sp. PLEO TaxID=3239306 RepID=UPI00351E821A